MRRDEYQNYISLRRDAVNTVRRVSSGSVTGCFWGLILGVVFGGMAIQGIAHHWRGVMKGLGEILLILAGVGVFVGLIFLFTAIFLKIDEKRHPPPLSDLRESDEKPGI